MESGGRSGSGAFALAGGAGAGATATAGDNGGRREGEKIGRSRVATNVRNGTAQSGLPRSAWSVSGGEAWPVVIALRPSKLQVTRVTRSREAIMGRDCCFSKRCAQPSIDRRLRGSNSDAFGGNGGAWRRDPVGCPAVLQPRQ